MTRWQELLNSVKKKKYWFTLCCLKGDQLESLNLSSANKVAMLFSADLL